MGFYKLMQMLLLSRLLSLHRSIVRLLETMVPQVHKLSSVTQTSRCYHDVIHLSRLLALCASRLEGSTAPTSVHGLLNVTEVRLL